ncbi:MAG: hypothetical protein ACRECT_01795 [Thermoplasmata archaeon]
MGKRVPESPLGVRLSQAEARQGEAKVERILSRVLRGLTPKALDRPHQFPGEPLRVSVRGMLLHRIEEELPPRGEVNALLSRMGIHPPPTAIYR